MKKIFILTLISMCSWAWATDSFKETCLSSREYITTIKFLRDIKEIQLPEKEIRRMADEVSKGCTNASQRFIKMTRLLTGVGINPTDALKTALTYSSQDDQKVEVFIEIFKQTYERKFLDLDSLNALRISELLTKDYEGDSKHLLKEFRNLVNFCKTSKSFEVPLPYCAQVSSEVVQLGHNYQGSVSEAFIKFIKFFEENKLGPTLNKKDSVNLAKRVLKHGPKAVDNFIETYQFAMAKSGLDVDSKKALEIATNISQRSTKVQ